MVRLTVNKRLNAFSYSVATKLTYLGYSLIRWDLGVKGELSRYFALNPIFPKNSMIGKILLWLQERIKFWTRPATSALIIGTFLDLTRSQTDLVVENARKSF